MTMTPQILFVPLFISLTGQVDGPPTASPKQDLGEASRNLQSFDWTDWLQKRSTRHQTSRDARKNGLKDNKQVLGEAPGNLQSVNGMDSEAPGNLQSVNGMDSEAPGNLQSVNGMDSEAPGNLQSVNGMDSEAPGNLQSVNGMDSEAPRNLQSVNGMDSEAPGNLQSVNGMDSEAPGNLQSVNGMDSEAPGNLQSVNRRERLKKRSIRPQRSRDARKNGLKEQNICHLEDIPNGEPKDQIYEYSVGEEGSISCHMYYMIDGPEKVKCLQDGTMTKRPTCVPVHYCSKFAELLNGIVNQPKWPKPGETANFNCNNGYRLNGVSTTKCQLDGNWDLERTPVCEERKIGSESCPYIAVAVLSMALAAILVFDTAVLVIGFKYFVRPMKAKNQLLKFEKKLKDNEIERLKLKQSNNEVEQSESRPERAPVPSDFRIERATEPCPVPEENKIDDSPRARNGQPRVASNDEEDEPIDASNINLVPVCQSIIQALADL